MGEPYIGEIRMFGGNFAPEGWALCDGQLIAIAENDALFTLIGTTYGGDGQETFALPNLQSRIPIHAASGYTLGQMAGVETVTLTTQQIPIHGHSLMATAGTAANRVSASGSFLGEQTTALLYAGYDVDAQFAANALAPVGGSQPHDNMPPFLCVNFIISLYGIFPQQT